MGPFVTAGLLAWAVLVVGVGGATAQSPSPAGAATQASAGAVPALPKALKGGINFRNPIGGRDTFHALDLEITSQDGAGKFAGTYTRWVQFAGANICMEFKKAPVDGTYDGKTLVVKVRASAQVPSCPDFTWELGPGKDHAFERNSPDGWERIYFDPVK